MTHAETTPGGRHVRRAWHVGALLLCLVSGSGRAEEPDGRQLAHGTAKGNCLACHRMPNDAAAVTSADIGPPLANMAERFPDRARLAAQIWDAAVAHPDTVMPPFGRNGVLTRSEIERIVDYLYTQ